MIRLKYNFSAKQSSASHNILMNQGKPLVKTWRGDHIKPYKRICGEFTKLYCCFVVVVSIK